MADGDAAGECPRGGAGTQSASSFNAAFQASNRRGRGITFMSHASVVANRIHFSRFFLAFHVVMLSLNLIILTW